MITHSALLAIRLRDGRLGVAAFVPLSDIVADARCSEGKSEHPGLHDSQLDFLCQVIRVDIAGVAIQQRYSDTNLRLVEVILRHAHRVVERRNSFLPAVRKLIAVPVRRHASDEHGFFCVLAGKGGRNQFCGAIRTFNFKNDFLSIRVNRVDRQDLAAKSNGFTQVKVNLMMVHVPAPSVAGKKTPQGSLRGSAVTCDEKIGDVW